MAAPYIDPKALVHDGAQIGEDCHIGPFCTVSPNAKIGKGTKLQSHVVVDGHTTIGENCIIFPFACIGMQTQDLKFEEGNICYTTIGNNTTIREYVTIHAGTDDGTTTSLGDNCNCLALSHIGHNCIVGNDVVLSHSATLGGHVEIADHCNIGGLSAIHQFCKIGEHAMVAGMARVVQDVLPYTISEGMPGIMRAVNKIGMERNNFTKDQIREARTVYKILFKRSLSLEEAVEEIQKELADSEVAKTMLAHIANSERGLCRPPQ